MNTTELEKAAIEHSKQAFNGLVIEDNIVAFIAGAEWQKQQMLKEAVEGYVAQRVHGKLYAKAPVLDEMGLDFGDKVRIIVLKEEEE